MTMRNARASHTWPKSMFLRRILRCVECADLSLPVISTRRPGARESSCKDLIVVAWHWRSEPRDASRDAPPTVGRPSAAVAAVASSAAIIAAAAAAAVFEFRSEAWSRSNGGTHASSALSSSCSSLSGLARFSRSSSLAAAIASSRIVTARFSASNAFSSDETFLFRRGVPAFSPRRTFSKNIWTSAPVGGSHVMVNADLTSPSEVTPSIGDPRSRMDSEAEIASSSAERSSSSSSRGFFTFLPDDLPSSGRYHASTLALITALNASGLTTAKDRSSISALAPNIPSCSANEHHT